MIFHRCYINKEDVELIRKIIPAYPDSSRRFLFQEVCRAWNWIQPNGVLKDLADMKSKTDILQENFSRQEIADSNKLKITVEGLKRAKDAGIKAETVVADVWYFVAWFVSAVLEYAPMPYI